MRVFCSRSCGRVFIQWVITLSTVLIPAFGFADDREISNTEKASLPRNASSVDIPSALGSFGFVDE